MPHFGQKTEEEVSRANSEALRGAIVGSAKVGISYLGIRMLRSTLET